MAEVKETKKFDAAQEVAQLDQAINEGYFKDPPYRWLSPDGSLGVYCSSLHGRIVWFVRDKQVAKFEMDPAVTDLLDSAAQIYAYLQPLWKPEDLTAFIDDWNDYCFEQAQLAMMV